MTHSYPKHFIFLLFLLLFVACEKEPHFDKNWQHKTWRSYGGGPDMSKYFIQDQITKDNVSQLEIAWVYATNDERSYQMNPIIVDSIMYVFAKNNSLVALNATNGEEIWIHANLNGISRRGMAYWESKDRLQRRLLFTLNNSLQAIDAITGKSILSFGENGVVDLRQGLNRDPDWILRTASHTPGKVFENLIILGSSPGEAYLTPPGYVRAYDVLSGALIWTFHTIPLPEEFGYETWPKEAYKYAGGVNCWGEITIDEESGTAFLPLGSPTYDYYGADRLGANLFGNCLVALDARTGERKWHFQTVHHDLWDYDLTAAPQLITVQKDGKEIDAVALATKQGFMFVMDRETGEQLWDVQEKPVPPSTIPGEEAWPTQPFPTVLPPFNRQTMTEADVSDIFLSPEEFESWKLRVKNAKKGLYTPPDTTETIAIPGAVGGANWGNTASNPDQGMVYVMTQDYPSFYKLQEAPPPLPEAYRERFKTQQAVEEGKMAFIQHCQTCHGKDLAGTALGPSLLRLSNQMDLAALRQTVLYGTGRMPPVQHIEEDEIAHLLAFLESQAKERKEASEKSAVEGPVVASGGAPAEKELQSLGVRNRAGDAYPEGVEVPESRYYTGYGLGKAYVIKPPWTSIFAYDMNTGTIKWKRPLGEDPHAIAAKRVRNTGIPTGSQRNGMIVTSTGIIFATVTNGKIYAFDAENGEILWTGATSMGIASIPSMYEVNGKVYLVVSATMPQVPGWNLKENDQPDTEEELHGVYQVFALPDPKIN